MFNLPSDSHSLLTAEQACFTYTSKGRPFDQYVHLIHPGEIEKWIGLAQKTAFSNRNHRKEMGFRVEVSGQCIVIHAHAETIVCDPGPSATAIVNSAASVAAFLITHAHRDHVQSLGYLLSVNPKASVVLSDHTLSLLQNDLIERGDYITARLLQENSIVLDTDMSVMLAGVSVTGHAAAHCPGALAYVLLDPCSGHSIVVAGEGALRDVGGFVPAQLGVNNVACLFLDGTHANATGLPTGSSDFNRRSIQTSIEAAYRDQRTLVFATSALGEFHELYTACAMHQRNGGASKYPLVTAGLARAHRQSITTPPWDIPLEESTTLIRSAINICGASFDEPRGFFWDIYQEFKGDSTIEWLYPQRFCEKRLPDMHSYDAYTHPSMPELLGMLLTMAPDSICIYSHGCTGSVLSRLAASFHIDVHDFGSGSGEFVF